MHSSTFVGLFKTTVQRVLYFLYVQCVLYLLYVQLSGVS